MFKILFITLAIASVAGCKITSLKPSDKLVTKIDGLEVPSSRELTAAELVVARRICTNLKTKREFFETLYNNTEKFKFSVQVKACTDSKVSNASVFEASIINASPTYLEYSANQTNYFQDIVTDQEGNTKVLCDSIFFGDHIQNTINVSTYQLIFNILINQGSDRLEISKLVKNAQGLWNLSGIETVDFVTQDPKTSNQDKKFFGVEKERTRRINCDGNNFSFMTQSWLGATTNF